MTAHRPWPMVENGHCSACDQPAERGSSRAWWHVGPSCYQLGSAGPFTRVVFVTHALDVRHTPVTIMVASADPEEPDFESACRVCWTSWPCLVAHLAGLPHSRPVPVACDWVGGHADEPPF